MIFADKTHGTIYYVFEERNTVSLMAEFIRMEKKSESGIQYTGNSSKIYTGSIQLAKKIPLSHQEKK